MNVTSRIALAVPLAVALSGPASATQFFDFSLSFTGAAGDFTLTGSTQAGADQFNTPYALSSLQNVLFDGQPVFFYAGGLTNGAGNPDTRFGGNQRIVFTGGNGINFVAPNSMNLMSVYFTTGSSWDSSQTPQTWFGITGNATYMFTNDNTDGAVGSYIPDVRGSQFSGQDTRAGANGSVDSSVVTVPEINGSGFAYIAFILGALGLWLYSGAGRARPKELPAAA